MKIDKQELKLFLKQELRNLMEENADNKIDIGKLVINLGKVIMIESLDKHYRLGLMEEMNVESIHDRDE